MAPTRQCLLGLDLAHPYDDGSSSRATLIDDGTSARAMSPLPGLGLLEMLEAIRQARAIAIMPDASCLQEALENLEVEEHEYSLISKYGTIATKDGRPLDTLEKYLDYRDTFIGARQNYRKFAAESDAEFEKSAKVMTQALHVPDAKAHLNADQKREAQKLLYVWVRAAYKHDKGSKFDVAQHVEESAEFSAELFKEINQIKQESGEKFTGGGFVVRPEVVNTLRLGSVSQHSEGEAIDINWDDNPQIPTATWKFIEDFVGMKVARDATRWNNDPITMYRNVRALSDGLVEKTAAEVKRWQEMIKWAHEIQRELKIEDEIAKSKGAAEHACVIPSDPPILKVLRQRLVPAKGPMITTPESVLHNMQPDPNDPAWMAWNQMQDMEKRFPKGIPESLSEAQAYDIIFAKLPDGKKNKLIKDGYVKKGFLTHSEKLVGLFHKHGFTWGLTLPTPDIMHFAKTRPADAKSDDMKPGKAKP